MANRTNTNTGRYSKNLSGWNAQGFFQPTGNNTAALATGTTLSSFLNSAAEGAIGVFGADGLAVDPTAAVSEDFFIAQKQNGDLKKTQLIKDGTYSIHTQAYAAAATQVVTIDPLAISIVGGLQEFVVQVRNTTPGNQPFPVTEGRSIVRSGTPLDDAIANDIIRDINNSSNYEGNQDERFVIATMVTDDAGAIIPTGTGTINVANGSNVITFATDVADATGATLLLINEYLRFGTTVTSPIYKIVSIDVPNEQITLDRPYEGTSDAAVANNTVERITVVLMAAGETGIVLTAVDPVTHFTVIASEDLADATVTATTAWALGAGESWQVAAMEDECAVFQGYTTGNEAFTVDYGKPATFVDDDGSAQYKQKFLVVRSSIAPSAGAPVGETVLQTNIVIASTGALLLAAIDLNFVDT